MGQDFWVVIQWWATLFLVGAIAFPLARQLFKGWWDDGYVFAKAVGMGVVSYLVYLIGSLRILPFTISTIWIALAVVFGTGFLLNRNHNPGVLHRYRVVILEEIFFFLLLLFWSWIKGHEPSIHSLEKFMDFGFTKSVLNSTFFPAADMWYAGSTINYYYFGHVVLATLTKLSGLDVAYTFNLMLAAIFAMTATISFSIGYHIAPVRKVVSGLLTAFLVTLAGNLQTIYAFTFGYTGDPPASGPPPFWQLGWSLEGLARYWYANATRFIPFTIHEFPSYSFVVSDVHGHVLSLPFVLLAIGLLIHLFIAGDSLVNIVDDHNTTFLHESLAFLPFVFYGFLAAILLMTNALDGPIYFALLIILFGMFHWKEWSLSHWKQIGAMAFVAVVASLPFLVHFKSFVSGVGVNCPPTFLANMKIGPFLFEGVEKCQHSPLWMLLILWGFFLYCGLAFVGQLRKRKKIPHIEKLLLIFFIFSICLIIFPEFFYFKDIYPAHFRSNTMFKLGYQAFILFSIASAYTIMTIRKKIFYIFLAPLLFLVSIYPIFSVRSYFNNLNIYEGIYGLGWFARAYPDDYAAVSWLNAQMTVYRLSPGVLVEIDGDSYTDSARFSTFTGMPTVIGWPVHEWLWRGSYDVVSPRRADVRRIYESNNVEEIKSILAKYNVRYIMVGTLERNAYPGLVDEKFLAVGKVAFRSGTTVAYEIRGY